MAKEVVGKDKIHVTMHIAARKKLHELQNNPHIKGYLTTALQGIMQPIESGAKIAKRLSLPEAVPVAWDVDVAALPEGFHHHPDRIPIMVSVAGVPDVMQRLQPEVVHEITNTIFQEIRHKETSLELAKHLGYETDKPVKFHLFLPHQVKVRGPAHPGSGDGDGDGGDGGPPVWVEGGWSKGCSSWPW